MDWYSTVFELIDMRSFSNLWFWIALAVMWSTTSHWVLGVPWDMVLRAQREGGQYEEDLLDIVRINTNRLLHIGTVSGLWLLGFACFFLTMLGLLVFSLRAHILTKHAIGEVLIHTPKRGHKDRDHPDHLRDRALTKH